MTGQGKLKIHCCICNRETSYELFSKDDDGLPRVCGFCQWGGAPFTKKEKNMSESEILYRQDIKDYFEFKIDNQ